MGTAARCYCSFDVGSVDADVDDHGYLICIKACARDILIQVLLKTFGGKVRDEPIMKLY